jgi:hypothetical protein
MIQDIIGRLKTLRLNIVNSPDFNTYTTNKSKELIDQVLQTFIKLNNNSMAILSSYTNTSNRVINSFNLNGNHSIKNRFQIMNDMSKTRLSIKIAPGIPSEMKKYALAKLDIILKL